MILVGGYPRSGTTLLMTIFHKYGLDIGYTEEKIQRVIDKNEGALEWFNDLDFYREIDQTAAKAVWDRWGKIHTLETLGLKDPYFYPEVIKHPGEWKTSRSVFAKIDISKCVPPITAVFCCRKESDVVKSMQKRRAEYRNMDPKQLTNVVWNMKFSFMRDAGEFRHIKWITLNFPLWGTNKEYFLESFGLIGLDLHKLSEAYDKMVDKGRIHYGLE